MAKNQKLKILGRGWSKLTFDRFIFREILFWSDLEGRIYSNIVFLIDFEGFRFLKKSQKNRDEIAFRIQNRRGHVII